MVIARALSLLYQRNAIVMLTAMQETLHSILWEKVWIFLTLKIKKPWTH